MADTDATHIVLQDPGTALADIEAKRELAALHTGPGSCPTCDEPLPCQTLRLLGKPFAGEIGYQADWASR